MKSLKLRTKKLIIINYVNIIIIIVFIICTMLLLSKENIFVKLINICKSKQNKVQNTELLQLDEVLF